MSQFDAEDADSAPRIFEEDTVFAVLLDCSLSWVEALDMVMEKAARW